MFMPLDVFLGFNQERLSLIHVQNIQLARWVSVRHSRWKRGSHFTA